MLPADAYGIATEYEDCNKSMVSRYKSIKRHSLLNRFAFGAD
jgi:hypothetical protein